MISPYIFDIQYKAYQFYLVRMKYGIPGDDKTDWYDAINWYESINK